MTTATQTTRHVVLVPGFWLGAWAWADVVPVLERAGLAAHPVTLPGLASRDEDRSGIALDDHVRAVLELVDGLDGDVVLVGHSGGALVVQGVVDRRPDRVRRVVYVDSGPMRDGVAVRPSGDGVDPAGDVELPSWEQLRAEGSSTDGLDDAALARFRERAVPHPGRVASAPIRVSDPRRLDVPATFVCTSLTWATLGQLVDAGHLPTELRDLRDVDHVDLPTGHWPMLSEPERLGAEIARAAQR